MEKKYNFRSTEGFTLIELIVVVAVIGILATVGFTVINPGAQFQKARDTQRKADLSQVQKAIEQYYHDNGSYPLNFAPNDFRIKVDGNAVDWGSSWLPYIGNLPKDPALSKNYVYVSNGQTYYLYASLDRGTDPQACNGGAACASVPSGASCGASATCNYGISSPNVSP